MDQQKNESEREENDLRQVIDVAIKNSGLIITMAVAGALAFFVVDGILPKVYEIKSIIEIGTIISDNQLKAVDDINQIKKKIEKDVYGEAVRKNLSMSYNEYPDIKAENSTGNFIFLTIRSANVDQAKSVLGQMGKEVINDYKNEFQIADGVVRKNLEYKKGDKIRIENKIKSLEIDIANSEKQILLLQGSVNYLQDPGVQFTISAKKEESELKKRDIENLYVQINQIDKDVNDLEALTGLSVPTYEFEAPRQSQNPVGVGRAVGVLSGGLVGFVVAVFYVFCRRWWQKNA